MSKDIDLKVIYYSQRDATVPGQAGRMCYSSTNAMALKYFRPNALPDIAAADDVYLKRVFQYGDTTMAHAQISALKSFGLNAEFRQNLGWDDVDAELLKGRPVALGILIIGHVSYPYGGGHWILVTGRTADGKYYRVNDPYGELDLVNGGYLNSKGKGLLYSRKNLTPRWRVRGEKGWGILYRP